MRAPGSTAGNAIMGTSVAALAAAQVTRLVAGEPAATGVEAVLDLGQQTLERSLLTRNPACRFEAGHREGWSLEPVEDISPAELVEEYHARRGPEAGSLASVEVAVPGRMFAMRTDCMLCGRGDEPGQLVFAHDPMLPDCRYCGAERKVTGFAQRSSATLASLPHGMGMRSLSSLGLRQGDVLELRFDDGRVQLELAARGARLAGADATPVAGAMSRYDRVLLVGLGNIGSFMAPLIARIRGLTSIVLCDFDHYEAGQQRSQAISAADAGRLKVDVAAEGIRQITSGLEVCKYPMPLEALPAGLLRRCIVVSALDSVTARLKLAERAWLLGSPFVDSGVGGGDSLIGRVDVYEPGPDKPCFECALDDEDRAGLEARYPCDQ